ncbi:hypothetical protein [Microvirga lenta]|uniref:hypothetical protein n=1 Tax=Microvirga lenta TaxID=2881337 RepID=UPI001CFD3D66|nr:hypothetical protein [Microvirga lenta]MCB5173581.1 hypothetical protein [Microvirga lenta]
MLIEQQRLAWIHISAVRENAYRFLRGEEPRTIRGLATDGSQGRVSVTRKLLTMAERDANALMRAQEGQRRAYGFVYKQEASTKEEAKAREERRKMVMSLLAGLVRFKRLQAN